MLKLSGAREGGQGQGPGDGAATWAGAGGCRRAGCRHPCRSCLPLTSFNTSLPGREAAGDPAWHLLVAQRCPWAIKMEGHG